MNETLTLLREVIEHAQAGRTSALCSVLQTQGSAPQRPGALLLVRPDSSSLGTLGGGCVEAEVRRRAFEMLREHRSALLDFDLDHDYGWDDGLICGGRMVVGVTPVGPPDNLSPYRDALAHVERREPAWLPAVFTQEGKVIRYRVHLEVPPTLLIAGAGHVGQGVAAMASGLGFHVVVIDDRADMASRDRFGPDVELVVGDIATALRKYPIDEACYVVIVTRGHRHDAQALEAVIRRPACYLGMIGSRRKARTIIDGLLASGLAPELAERVRSPIGVPIGSITVPEIAVSIAAELVQQRRRHVPRLVEGPEELTGR